MNIAEDSYDPGPAKHDCTVRSGAIQPYVEDLPAEIGKGVVKDGVVVPNRLNLRAGPGENYSVLGRLEKGAAVKSIRTIEEWMERADELSARWISAE